MYIPLITTFVLVLGITIFALQNGQPLEVKFITWGFETSLVAVIFGAAIIGSLIVAVFSFPLIIKKHFRANRLAKQVQELEKKSQELGNELQQKKEADFSLIGAPLKKE